MWLFLYHVWFKKRWWDRWLLVVGIKDVGDADVQSQFDLFRKVLDEVCESFGDEKENLSSKSLVSIKKFDVW